MTRDGTGRDGMEKRLKFSLSQAECRSEGDKRLPKINVKAEVKVEKQKNHKNLG